LRTLPPGHDASVDHEEGQLMSEQADPKGQNDEGARELNDPKRKHEPEKMIGNIKEKVRDEGDEPGDGPASAG
jgi:hypothetical protein